MREKLKKLRDVLVVLMSFEVVLIASILLFDTTIIKFLWDVVKVDLVIGLFYGWAWLMEVYFDGNDSISDKVFTKVPDQVKVESKAKNNIKEVK